MMPRGRANRYPPGRNVPGPLQDAGTGQPIPLQPLATALANATPEQQRTVSLFSPISMTIYFAQYN